MIVALLALVGIGFVLLEFLFPSGLLALAAALCLIGSVVLFHPLGGSAGATAVFALLLLLLTGGASALALFQVRRRVALHNAPSEVSGQADTALLGAEGVVASDLKPSGHVRIGQDLFHAMAQVGYVSKGVAVKVVEIRGATLIVKPLK